jgi:hypothetical protein
MAHHEGKATAVELALEVLSEHGLEGMAEAIQTLVNEAMRIERTAFLGAAPGERTADPGFDAEGLRGGASPLGV